MFNHARMPAKSNPQKTEWKNRKNDKIMYMVLSARIKSCSTKTTFGDPFKTIENLLRFRTVILKPFGAFYLSN